MTVVDANGAALLNELVLPHDPILDYNTRYPLAPLEHPWSTRVRTACGAVWLVLQGYDSSGTLARPPGCGPQYAVRTRADRPPTGRGVCTARLLDGTATVVLTGFGTLGTRVALNSALGTLLH